MRSTDQTAWKHGEFWWLNFPNLPRSLIFRPLASTKSCLQSHAANTLGGTVHTTVGQASQQSRDYEVPTWHSSANRRTVHLKIVAISHHAPSQPQLLHRSVCWRFPFSSAGFICVILVHRFHVQALLFDRSYWKLSLRSRTCWGRCNGR